MSAERLLRSVNEFRKEMESSIDYIKKSKVVKEIKKMFKYKFLFSHAFYNDYVNEFIIDVIDKTTSDKGYVRVSIRANELMIKNKSLYYKPVFKSRFIRLPVKKHEFNLFDLFTNKSTYNIMKYEEGDYDLYVLLKDISKATELMDKAVFYDGKEHEFVGVMKNMSKVSIVLYGMSLYFHPKGGVILYNSLDCTNILRYVKSFEMFVKNEDKIVENIKKYIKEVESLDKRIHKYGMLLSMNSL